MIEPVSAELHGEHLHFITIFMRPVASFGVPLWLVMLGVWEGQEAGVWWGLGVWVWGCQYAWNHGFNQARNAPSLPGGDGRRDSVPSLLALRLQPFSCPHCFNFGGTRQPVKLSFLSQLKFEDSLALHALYIVCILLLCCLLFYIVL